MKYRTIKYYRKQNKNCPIEEFIEEQNEDVQEKIFFVLKLIEDLQIVPIKFFKKLKSNDIWECRIRYNKNIYRILGFFDEGNFVILTNGFQKKTQKTPKNEIEIAEEYKKDYLNNK